MRVVIAPDSFKGTNDAVRVAELIKRGVLRVFPHADTRCIPAADGGEGTVTAVVAAAGGELREISVTGPVGDPVSARYGLLPGGRGVIEMAAASGLPLVPQDRQNPEHTTTYGTGELMADALDAGCRELLIGVGGSATNDGGIGMAEALGYRFLDEGGVACGHDGEALRQIASISTESVDPRISESRFVVACDVQNPLYGRTGAAFVYGPQKGADQEMVVRLDEGLRNLSRVIGRDLGVAVDELPGAGAAGGLGAGLVAFCGAELESGIDAVLDLVRFDEMLEGVDLIITGEGALDGSTAYGKVPVGIARRATERGIPVLAIVGNIGPGAEAVYELGIDGVMTTVSGAMPLEEALRRSGPLIEDAAMRLMRFVDVGMRMGRS